MQLVIADTSPVNYLLLIEHIDILPALFGRVILPATVREELQHPKAPLVVRNWISALPAWVDVRDTPSGVMYDASRRLDAGEQDAIALAIELHADLLLMDDEEGVIAAHDQGFEVTGTLGILSRAAGRGLIDLAEAFARVRRTNFRYPPELMIQLLAELDPKRGLDR